MSTTPVYVLGVGMIPFGRHPTLDVKQLKPRFSFDSTVTGGVDVSNGHEKISPD